jgi:hypothetical protein
MTEAVTLVKRSLFLIGAHSLVNPAPPETLNLGVDMLNEMLAEWLEEKVDLGTVEATEQTTDIQEPAGTINGITNNLAVRMGPATRTAVPDDVRLEAVESYERIRKRYEAKDEPYVPDVTPSRLLPVGQGSSRGALARTFFTGKPTSDEAPNT